jgi:hypothetical protein
LEVTEISETNKPKEQMQRAPTAEEHALARKLVEKYEYRNRTAIIEQMNQQGTLVNYKIILPPKDELAKLPRILADSVQSYIRDQAEELIKHKRGVYD